MPGQRERGQVNEQYKSCINCGNPLQHRLEEEGREVTGASRATGQCEIYRIWFCVNPDCVMFKTDVYEEQVGEVAGEIGRSQPDFPEGERS